MRLHLWGRSLLALCALCVSGNIASAGFHHRHHRLHRGGCSDPCQTASAWGGVAYNSAYAAPASYGPVYGPSAGPAYGPAYGAGMFGSGYCAPSAPAPTLMLAGPGRVLNGYAAGCQPYPGGQAGGLPSYCGPVSPATNYLSPAPAAPAMPAPAMAQMQTIDLGPMTMYKVVLEPQVVNESRIVCGTEYRDEVRQRTRVVQRTQPVQYQDYRTKTVMVPKTETKTIEYSVLVPHTSEKTVEVVESVPVWKESQETYTVKVPVISDVQEEYQVTVPQLQDQEFTYTVYVPQAHTQTRMQTVTNAVPVTKTRTIQVCNPVTRMTKVTKDYGHWETRMEEVAVQSTGGFTGGVYAPSGCGSGVSYGAAPGAAYGMGGCSTFSGPAYGAPACGSGCASGRHRHGCRLLHHHRGGCSTGGCSTGGCSTGACGAGVGYGAPGCGVASYDAGQGLGSGCGGYEQVVQTAPATQTVARQVWVPNVVTEDVAVTENVSQTQEITYTVYEQRSEQVPYEATYVTYQPESRTGTRKVVTYVPEKRTRTRKVVSYNDEQRTRTLRQASYEQRTRTETIPVVSYTTEKRTKEVSYTVTVPETQVGTDHGNSI